MKRSFLFIILSFSSYFSLFSQSDITKDSSNWQNFNFNHSNQSLQEYKQYFKTSHTWDVNNRVNYLKKGITSSIEIGNDTFSFWFSEKLGSLYNALDSNLQSLSYLNQALAYSYDVSTRRIAYNSLGGLHARIDDYNTAIDYYFKAMQEAKKLKDGSEAYVLGNISEAYYMLEDYDNAFKYIKQSIGFSKRLESPEREYSLVYDYSYVADWYNKIHKRDSAQKYLNLILVNIKKINTINEGKYQDACFIGYYMIADFYLKNKLPEAARNYIKLTNQYAQEFYKSSVYLLQGQYSYLIKKYDTALKHLDKIDLDTEDLTSQQEAISLQIKIYKALQDYQNVALLQEKLLNIQKEKFSDDRVRFSAFANIKYETLQKNEEINTLKLNQELQNLTLKNQRFFSIIVSIICLSITSIMFLLWQRYQYRKELSINLQKQVDIKTRDLQFANKDLELLNEELKTFNHIASHDIKEPIRNIGNYASLIYRKLPNELQLNFKDYFTIIKHGTQQLYTLLEDFARYTSLSKKKDIQLEKVYLNTIVKNLKYIFLEKLQQNQGEIITEDLPIIHSSPSFIYIILKNIIENGLKFNNSVVPTIWLSYKETEVHHKIIIKDNGIGIDSAYFSNIFEMFSRLHERGKYPGSGIGLAIAMLLVNKLSGTILVNSKPENGSIFTIILPK